MNPSGTRVYVANNYWYLVAVIDTSTNTVVATVDVRGLSHGIVVNPAGTRVYVTGTDLTSTGRDKVSSINTSTNTLVNFETVPLQGPNAHARGIAVNPAGTRLYVSDSSRNAVAVISTSNTFLLTTISMGVGLFPNGVAVTPSGARVYVANSNSGTVSVIDTGTNKVIPTATVAVGSFPVAFGQFIGPDVPTSVNHPPVASAGSDQTVNEGTLVTLDGSGSLDPDKDPLTFTWEQVSGPAVALDLTDPLHPTFAAPSVAVGGATLTFRLTVSDGSLTSTDTVNITVKNVNHPPVADAGADQVVAEGTLVALDGSGSFDSDGESLTYSWLQTAGNPVVLSDSTAVKPSFTAPQVGAAGTLLTFTLTVSDGIETATDAVNVTVQNVNHAPVANAGDDQTKNEGTLVTLDGSKSVDPDGDPLVFTWTQVARTSVALDRTDPVRPTFVAPLVGPGGEILRFQLVVSDGLGGVSAQDEVQILIQNVNDPPVCGMAQPSQTELGSPNHKLIPINILGVTDPDNDNVTITITGVTQDEPVNGLGDGDTSPDAVIQGSTVLLRAERSGHGNGRVYKISFTANDGFGGTCIGSVNVTTLFTQRGGVPAIDDGQLYDSTQP